jgi:hypothetical protein
MKGVLKREERKVIRERRERKEKIKGMKIESRRRSIQQN